MAQDTYTQYIFKDGEYRLVSSSGGSSPAPTKNHDFSKRTMRDLPGFYYDKNYNTTGASFDDNIHYIDSEQFLDTSLLGPAIPFDFNNHNYYWAYSNSKGIQNRILYQQRARSEVIPFLNAKRLRKVYSNKITSIPTWRSFLVELFGENFISTIYSSTSTSSTDEQVKIRIKRGGHSNTGWDKQINIYIPIKNTLDDISTVIDAICNSRLSVNKNKIKDNAEELKIDLFNKSINSISYSSGVINIVKDVTSYDRVSNGKQYIPGDIVSRFQLTDVYYTRNYDYAEGTGALIIKIKSQNIPAEYIFYKGDDRYPLTCSTGVKIYKAV